MLPTESLFSKVRGWLDARWLSEAGRRDSCVWAGPYDQVGLPLKLDGFVYRPYHYLFVNGVRFIDRTRYGEQ